MTRHGMPTITLAVTCAVAIGAGSCKKKPDVPGKQGASKDEASKPEEPVGPVPKTKLGTTDTARVDFARWLEPVLVDVTPRVKPYPLPLEESSIANLEEVKPKVGLGPGAQEKLFASGAVVVENPFDPREEYFTPVYDRLKGADVPVFVTTDSLLHAYHVMFDATLRSIEETKFYPSLWAILEALIDDQEAIRKSTTGEVREAARRNVAYLSVALSLLAPSKDQICDKSPWECPQDRVYFYKDEFAPKHEPLACVKEDVEKELALIAGHADFASSPIFEYQEDYTQYVPRGHYTATERLKNYFSAFMWLGRISMLLKGRPADGSESGLVSEDTARIQTMQAAMLASSIAGDPEIMKGWERIYSVTAFYVGISDDLGPYEYVQSMKKVFGETFEASELDAGTVGKLKAELAAYSAPRIYGGTGNCTLPPPFTPESANQCLEDTKGFRFMGQRFIPDSYLFSNIVFPQTGLFIGGSCDAVFSCEMVMMKPQRVFPRGLDVMVLLGSKRAPAHLARMGDSSYENYAAQMEALEAEFDAFTEDDWHRNLYWAWLDALKPLLVDFPEGYPTFMRTDAWQDKELVAALASWTELRHDTILYAKQSYAMAGAGAPIRPPPRPVVGYVEPVPGFYARLLALTRMTREGLVKMDAIDQQSKYRLESLEKTLERLLDISITELENEELTPQDHDFIKHFGASMDFIIGDVEESTRRVTIVADVHTDGNTKLVLEEGLGYVRLVVVAYRLPDGRILVGAGPVFSHHEFTHPMSDRLTDEKWRELIETKPPLLPVWSTSYPE